MYYRCRTLKGARHMARGMERYWSILKIVHQGTDLVRRSKEYERVERKRIAEVSARLKVT